jgi:hypothetical protein
LGRDSLRGREIVIHTTCWTRRLVWAPPGLHPAAGRVPLVIEPMGLGRVMAVGGALDVAQYLAPLQPGNGPTAVYLGERGRNSSGTRLRSPVIHGVRPS